MLRRVWAVMQKEFIQTFRDRRTLLIQVSLPMIQLFLFGYAISMSVEHIPTVVADRSFDTASLAYTDAMVTSGFFDVVDYLPGQDEVIQALDEGRAHAGIVIPPEFAAGVERGTAQVLFLVDGSDLFTAQSAYNAATSIAQTHATQIRIERLERSGKAAQLPGLQPIDARLRILYNPNLSDLWFLIPGMVAMLLQTQSIALTAAAVVREREVGTIEQILVTPIRSGELLLGKIAPNLVIALLNMVTIVGLGVYWFGVPFQGNFWLFAWLSFMYVFSGLGLGLLVSTVSQNQKQAHHLGAMIMLLGVILGGFIFPRYTMPWLIRVVGNLFPLTYFIPIARGVISKGVGIPFFWEQVVAMCFYIVAIMVIAARAFNQGLE
jgi:ABC-2 type transport system permease protein